MPEDKAAYLRDYYEKNLEQIRANHRAYYAKNRERMLAQGREWRRKHQKEVSERQKAIRRGDPEVMAAHNARSARWKKLNPDKVRDSAKRHLEKARERKYGITPEAFEAMLASQNHRCAICRVDRPGHGQGWHLDHDHATGAARGILCASCNHCLGKFKDDPHVVMAAATYLLTHMARRKAV